MLKIVGYNHKVGTFTAKNGQVVNYDNYEFVTWNQENREAPYSMVKVKSSVLDALKIRPEQIVYDPKAERKIVVRFSYDQFRNVDYIITEFE